MIAWLSLLVLTGASWASPPAATVDSQPAPIPALPDNHQQCTVDADCVVAPALAGWAVVPPADATCQAVCTVGIHRSALAPWLALVKAKAHAIPCELEMEPCPPDEHFAAHCVSGTCTVKYTGGKTK